MPARDPLAHTFKFNKLALKDALLGNPEQVALSGHLI